jgi:hypothetical protein
MMLSTHVVHPDNEAGAGLDRGFLKSKLRYFREVHVDFIRTVFGWEFRYHLSWFFHILAF